MGFRGRLSPLLHQSTLQTALSICPCGRFGWLDTCLGNRYLTFHDEMSVMHDENSITLITP